MIINTSLRFLIVASLFWALATTSANPAGVTHSYVVTVSDDLRELQVKARFAPRVTDLSARSRDAGKYLIAASDCGNGQSLRAESQRLVVDRRGIECLAYSVNLAQVARDDRRNGRLGAATAVVSPTQWLWRPRLGGEDDVIVTFRLPAGVDVSVPWQPIADQAFTYRLRSSPQSGSAITIFGRFARGVVHAAGVDLRVVSLLPEDGKIDADVLEWLRETVRNITLAYGRFPNPDARIVLFTAASRWWRSDSAVHFGRVVRDGGETIELLIDPSQPIESFLLDWTATHEFSHLMMPYVSHKQRWISEGFAQYYQNLLLARAGRYSQQSAWQKLYDGLQRGRESAPALSPNEAAAGESRNTRMKVYWSGAALALIADVELRRRSNGEESLDDVLDRFQRCCLPSRRTWTGLDLFRQFDRLIDEPLFVDLYRDYANTAGFPEFRPLMARLGVLLDGDEIRLIENSDFAEIRATLTEQRYTGGSDR